MARSLISLLALCAAFALILPQVTTAQNDDGAAAAPSDGNSDAAKKEVEYRGPLPFYFGKLGLDDDQKKKLYAIDDEYEAKIQEIEKQIQKLKDERDAKMETLLTAGQKLRLQELREAAEKKAAKEAASAPAAE